ncbi:aldo/keto reductase, partial [Paenibacillus sepulcri]|nr:aldo/keto reductase [Paenibacillus sepulcri]
VSLAWLLAQSHVSSVLIGSSKAAQLEENLNAADLNLTSEEIARLEQLTRPAPLYPNWYTTMTLDSPVAEALK